MNETINNEWNNLVKNQKSHSKEDNKSISPQEISSYIFIYDCFENTILYVNSAFKTILGHDEKKLNLEFLINIIHPDDFTYFISCEERGLNFTNKLLFNEHFKYIISYSYRIQTNDGSYVQILQQCQALEVNNSGHLTKTLVTHKIIDLKTASNLNYKIFDKSKNMYIDEDNSYALSPRELEILHFIKDGKNSKEISEILNISKNTVLTHRKNILNKTDSSSFIELIKKISLSYFE